jgi:signal transduction histidine kinase
VVVPLIIWAALRFGPRETSLTMLIVTIEALAGAIRGEGPFATGTRAHHVTLVELFVGFIAPTALAVTAGMCQRRRAERELQAAHRTLELRVEERTRELLHANAELRARSQAMAEKNDELESFVHNVSHDLRAPLHNLRGFCDELALACDGLGEVARDPRLPAEASLRIGSIVREDVAPSLQFVQTSAARLQRLVDALTQLSRQGRAPLAKGPVDLQAVLEATRDILRTPITTRGATLTLGPLPTIQGDATALERVFTNLVGNALAYLDPARVGQIAVGASPPDDPDGRDAGMVHVWVRDNGRGIPTRDQAKVFQVFQRFHPDAAPGEGIGLAIVKRIVERHGGRVWATSEEGVGSVFHLTLPT